MMRWPSGEKRGAERHAGEIADDLALAGLDIEQVNARITLAELHVGDFLRGRRETRRQHQIRTTGEIAHIGTILIHHRKALHATLLRTSFIDEHNAAVEVALLAGQTFVDLVGNDVRDPPPGFRRRKILLACKLLRLRNVPQAEFRLEASVTLTGGTAGHQRLRIDAAPVLELRRHVNVRDALDVGGLIDRREQSAAPQIVGDDLRNAG